MSDLSLDERATLLQPCACGHEFQDHGSYGNCWVCPEDNRECDRNFEDLLCERVAEIVEKRVQRRVEADESAAQVEVGPVRSFESRAQELLLREVTDAILRDVFQGRRDQVRTHMLNVAARVARRHPWPFFNEVVEAEVQSRMNGSPPRDYLEAAMVVIAPEKRTNGHESASQVEVGSGCVGDGERASEAQNGETA